MKSSCPVIPESPPESEIAFGDRKNRIGRPRGKRSDPTYRQCCVWIRRETHKTIRELLLRVEPSRDFSELVGELLDGWIDSRREVEKRTSTTA